ncbi:MAG: PadR family transcriptional regulator, partial [Bacteroidota bacterium]
EDHGRMYGYQISQKVKEISEGKILLKDGSLYPALHKLLDEGKLGYEEQAIGKRVRKYYYLTTQGKEAKHRQITELQDFMHTIKQIISPQLI